MKNSNKQKKKKIYVNGREYHKKFKNKLTEEHFKNPEKSIYSLGLQFDVDPKTALVWVQTAHTKINSQYKPLSTRK